MASKRERALLVVSEETVNYRPVMGVVRVLQQRRESMRKDEDGLGDMVHSDTEKSIFHC